MFTDRREKTAVTWPSRMNVDSEARSFSGSGLKTQKRGRYDSVEAVTLRALNEWNHNNVEERGVGHDRIISQRSPTLTQSRFVKYHELCNNASATPLIVRLLPHLIERRLILAMTSPNSPRESIAKSFRMRRAFFLSRPRSGDDLNSLTFACSSFSHSPVTSLALA